VNANLRKKEEEDKPTGLLEKKWAHLGPMEMKVRDRGRNLNAYAMST
jgi:hypothetical protein